MLWSKCSCVPSILKHHDILEIHLCLVCCLIVIVMLVEIHHVMLQITLIIAFASLWFKKYKPTDPL